MFFLKFFFEKYSARERYCPRWLWSVQLLEHGPAKQRMFPFRLNSHIFIQVIGWSFWCHNGKYCTKYCSKYCEKSLRLRAYTKRERYTNSKNIQNFRNKFKICVFVYFLCKFESSTRLVRKNIINFHQKYSSRRRLPFFHPRLPSILLPLHPPRFAKAIKQDLVFLSHRSKLFFVSLSLILQEKFYSERVWYSPKKTGAKRGADSQDFAATKTRTPNGYHHHHCIFLEWVRTEESLGHKL